MIFIQIIVAALLGLWGMSAAGKRNRNKVIWFFATFLMALPCLIAVYVAEPLNSQDENDKLGKIMLGIAIGLLIISFCVGVIIGLAGLSLR